MCGQCSTAMTGLCFCWPAGHMARHTRCVQLMQACLVPHTSAMRTATHGVSRFRRVMCKIQVQCVPCVRHIWYICTVHVLCALHLCQVGCRPPQYHPKRRPPACFETCRMGPASAFMSLASVGACMLPPPPQLCCSSYTVVGNPSK